MTASNSPFVLSHAVRIQVSSQHAWDLFCAPTQARQNPAIKQMDATLGFHTGSVLTFDLQTLKGPLHISGEVTNVTPPTYVEWVSGVTQWLCRHTETWSFEFQPTKVGEINLVARYHLNGVFAARLWPKRRDLIRPVLELWLESLKQQLEKL